jgi:peptidoglycan/LPS O-acetylase OafA/YrhL
MRQGAEPVKTSASHRSVAIDVVRGLAALTVLFSHLPTFTSVGAGQPLGGMAQTVAETLGAPIGLLRMGGGIHPGVIIFIVLSGFCIHLPCARDSALHTRPGFWANYALRRSLRILPVYWFCLALGLAAVLIIGTHYAVPSSDLPPSASELAIGTAASASILSEWLRYAGLGSMYAGNTPLQTVAVELWLYATYPIVLFLIVGGRYVSLLGLALASYALVTAIRFSGAGPEYVYSTYFEFLTYWIWGAVCAEYFLSFAPCLRRQRSGFSPSRHWPMPH